MYMHKSSKLLSLSTVTCLSHSCYRVISHIAINYTHVHVLVRNISGAGMAGD